MATPKKDFGLKKTVETSIGPVALRGLLRREVKELRQKGVNFGRTLNPDELDAAMEKALAVVLSEEQVMRLDDLYESEVLELYLELTRLTYPTPDQLKNFE